MTEQAALWLFTCFPCLPSPWLGIGLSWSHPRGQVVTGLVPNAAQRANAGRSNLTITAQRGRVCRKALTSAYRVWPYASYCLGSGGGACGNSKSAFRCNSGRARSGATLPTCPRNWLYKSLHKWERKWGYCKPDFTVAACAVFFFAFPLVQELQRQVETVCRIQPLEA